VAPLPLPLLQTFASLSDRDDVTAVDLKDLAVWMTEALGTDLLSRVDGCAPREALRRLRQAVFAHSSLELRELKGKAMSAALGSEEATTSASLTLTECPLKVREASLLVARERPALQRLRIDRCRLDAPALGVLTESTTLRALDELSLRSNPIGDEGAARLAHSTAFPRLRALGLSFGRITSTGLSTLLSGPALARLRSLRLGTDKLGPDLARILTSGPALERLELWGMRLGAHGLATLSAAPSSRELRALALMECEVGQGGARALAASPVIAQLEELRLRYDAITDECVEALARGFRSLRRLQMSQCRLSAQGLAALLQAEGAERLEVLHLGTHSSMKIAGLSALGKQPLPVLRQLDVDGWAFGDEGLALLADTIELPALESLSLQNDGITDAGLRSLSRWPQLPRLKRLFLGTNDITDAGLEALFSVGLPQLEELEIYQTRCSPDPEVLAGRDQFKVHRRLSFLDWPDD